MDQIDAKSEHYISWYITLVLVTSVMIEVEYKLW